MFRRNLLSPSGRYVPSVLRLWVSPKRWYLTTEAARHYISEHRNLNTYRRANFISHSNLMFTVTKIQEFIKRRNFISESSSRNIGFPGNISRCWCLEMFLEKKGCYIYIIIHRTLLSNRWLSCFIFGRSRVQKSVRRPATLTESFRVSFTTSTRQVSR
jgi:hypothetical protein